MGLILIIILNASKISENFKVSSQLEIEFWAENSFSIKLIALKSNGAAAIYKKRQYWIRIANF